MFSSWTKLIQGVPPGSVLGPTKLNDIDICNFADDTTAYVCDVNLQPVLEKLEENFELAVTCL